MPNCLRPIHVRLTCKIQRGPTREALSTLHDARVGGAVVATGIGPVKCTKIFGICGGNLGEGSRGPFGLGSIFMHTWSLDFLYAKLFRDIIPPVLVNRLILLCWDKFGFGEKK